MPTYVYACKNCGHQFEQYQSFSDDALTLCPQCEQETLRKVFNSVGIVFKGSGFYRTDSQAGTVGSGETKSSSSPQGSSTDTSSTSSDSSGGSTEKAAPTKASSSNSGGSSSSAAASA